MASKKIRLPRKRKKWLKKFGGWEYYIQVPVKNIGQAMEEDFVEMMKELENDSDFKWPEYDSNGNVSLSGKDSNGIEWFAMMRAETFHEAVRKEVKKQYGK